MAARTSFVRATPAPRPPSPQSPSACRPVLADLLRERAAIEPIRAAVPHLWALLDAEIARLGAAAADAKTAATLSSLAAGLARSGYRQDATPKSTSPPNAVTAAPKKRVKLPVPADKYPEYNFVGRLLGPRGTTLKTLERDTGCKIMIRGKGSIRKDKEPEVRGKPGWEHVFNEALHVVIEAGESLDDASATMALNRAKEAVEVLLVPVPEERDSLKRQQLRALAIMNGTYRGGGNPSRSLDGFGGLSSFSSSPPASQHPSYSFDGANMSVFLGDSVAASMRHHPLQGYDPHHEEQNSLLRQASYGRVDHPVESQPLKPTGRRSPSSGSTSPKPGMYDSNSPTGDEISGLSAKMQQCGVVEEFASSSVGDDSPESSHSSEDGEPSTHIMGNGYTRANVKASAMSPPAHHSDTALGVGGFLGQEFYNGAFSNGPSPNPWDQAGSVPPFSVGLYGLSPIPSPQVLTTSTSTITPIDRRDGGY